MLMLPLLPDTTDVREKFPALVHQVLQVATKEFLDGRELYALSKLLDLPVDAARAGLLEARKGRARCSRC